MAVVYDHDYCLHAKCAENADCTEIQFGHNCDCHRGFKGDGVNFCVDIDECSLANRPVHNRKGPFQNCIKVFDSRPENLILIKGQNIARLNIQNA